MNNSLRLLFALAIASSCNEILACRTIEQSPEQRLGNSDLVVSARVVMVQVPALEVPATRDSDYGSLLAAVDEPRVYRLAIIQVVKGEAQKVITISVTPCGGGRAGLGERVTAYRSRGGSWFISPVPIQQPPEATKQ